MEARVIDPLFHILFPSKLLYAVGSFVVRTSNTFVGSAQASEDRSSHHRQHYANQ